MQLAQHAEVLFPPGTTEALVHALLGAWSRAHASL